LILLTSREVVGLAELEWESFRWAARSLTVHERASEREREGEDQPLSRSASVR